MKAILVIAAVSLAIASGSVASAQSGTQHGMNKLAEGSWDHTASLESCMNGHVSATGLYPTQHAENMSFSTRGVMARVTPE